MSLSSEDIHRGLAPRRIRVCQTASRAMFLSGLFLSGDWSRTGLPTKAQGAVGESRPSSSILGGVALKQTRGGKAARGPALEQHRSGELLSLRLIAH